MLFDRIVPSAVHVSEAFADREDATLLPGEAQLVAGASIGRRREFATVRACARDALASLGATSGPILHAPSGAPVWPSNVVGSMTHCRGFRAAAVASKDDVAGIGIDCEPAIPLPHNVIDAIALPIELAMLRRLAADVPSIAWDRVLFCAKEAAFKVFPARQCGGLQHHLIRIRLGAGTFTARIGQPAPNAQSYCVAGRWLNDLGLICVAATAGQDDFNPSVPPGPQ